MEHVLNVCSSHPFLTDLVVVFYHSLDVAIDGYTRVNFVKYDSTFSTAGVFYRTTCCNDECSEFDKGELSLIITDSYRDNATDP